MCLEGKFKDFKRSLTDIEIEAIENWLGVWSNSIRIFQKTGFGEEMVVRYERNFTLALEKAVVCQKTIYRGLSAGSWRPDSIEYMKNLIEGSECYELPCHDSASSIESVGRAFMFTGPSDEERNLAILLKIKSKTARYLHPFSHKEKNEGEVVLLKGTKYKRISAINKPDPKPNLEVWELEVEEIT